eukprot:GEMP01023901.1.p1 GENE.GEMP01023901.1~~GEMP01023901.1.p1  ORF type:complete len:403 (+),score=86.55 GEMP01023901.1:247-1455(+)
MGEEQAIAPLAQTATPSGLPCVLFLHPNVFPLYQKCTGWDRWDCRKVWRRREDAPRWSKQKKPWCNTCGHAESIPFGEWLPEQYGPTWFIMLSREDGHFVTNIDPPTDVHQFRPVAVPGPVNPPPQLPGEDVLQAFWQQKYGMIRIPPIEPSREACMAQNSVPTYDAALAANMPYGAMAGQNMLHGLMDSIGRPFEIPHGTAAWSASPPYQTTSVPSALPATDAGAQWVRSNPPLGNTPVCLPPNVSGPRQHDYAQPMSTHPQQPMVPPQPVQPAHHAPPAQSAQLAPPVQPAQAAQAPQFAHHASPAQPAQTPQFHHSKEQQSGSSNSTVESADLELKQVRAVEAFDAASFDDADDSMLSLAPGDIIEIDVEEAGHDGWVFGRNVATNLVGWFPEGYTDPL